MSIQLVPSRRRSARSISFTALAAALAVACVTLPSSAQEQIVEVAPESLQAAIVGVTFEGALCPEGSLGLASSGPTLTAIFQESVDGEQLTGCKLTLELEVPEGLSLGMPTTIVRGVLLEPVTLARRYSFQGAAAVSQTSAPGDNFVVIDRLSGLTSPSCQGARRVFYEIDLSAELGAEGSFFQIDSVDVDTSFRFGTDWEFCDATRTLQVAPGQSGDFCDGPQGRPCAEGLRCDRERIPTAAEGQCIEP
jgi:uncharacterized protein DUF4360